MSPVWVRQSVVHEGYKSSERERMSVDVNKEVNLVLVWALL